MNSPLVSIVMVNYNHDDFLQEAISSVLEQTYQNWELILVDDGSTDRSGDIIRSFQDPRIKPVYLEKNRHICVATNTGFSRVGGAYVARLDSDDVWRPDKLEHQVAYMEAHPDIGLCFTRLEIIGPDSKVVPREDLPDLYNLYDNRQESREAWLRFFFFYGNSLIQSSLLMRREVLDHLGDFNLAYVQAHDFDYFVRAAKYYEFGFLEEPLLKYRRNTEQNSAVNPENDLRFFNEHMSIRRHFFDDFSDELFVGTFRECFVNKEASSHEELLCEQAFLLMETVGFDRINPVLGLEKMETLLNDPKIRETLEIKYGFTPKSFYQETKKNLYYTYELHQKLRELEWKVQDLTEKTKHQQDHIDLLMAVKDQQQRQIESMENSTSWKMTRPVRKMGSVIRRKG